MQISASSAAAGETCVALDRTVESLQVFKTLPNDRLIVFFTAKAIVAILSSAEDSVQLLLR